MPVVLTARTGRSLRQQEEAVAEHKTIIAAMREEQSKQLEKEVEICTMLCNWYWIFWSVLLS